MEAYGILLNSMVVKVLFAYYVKGFKRILVASYKCVCLCL